MQAGGFGTLTKDEIDSMDFAQRAKLGMSVQSRRAMQDAAVAGGVKREASSASAFGAVRSGDARRRKNFERERLKREGTTERSNELLGKILGTWQGGEEAA